jgi:hypothetical protein
LRETRRARPDWIASRSAAEKRPGPQRRAMADISRSNSTFSIGAETTMPGDQPIR